MVLANPLTCTNTPKGEDKLYSDAKGVVPSLDLRFAEGKNLNDYMTGTPLVDHQRSMFGSNLSAGTFVNSSGLIETAKVNALTANSEVFSGWPVPSTATQTTTSPFNTTAEAIDRADATSITVNDPSAVTFSGYFKQGSSRYVYLRSVNWISIANCRVWFDLQTGNFVNVSPGAAPISNAFATSVGNGWYRCGFTLDSTGDSVGNIQIRATDSSTNISNVGYVFAFGIQVEEGPVSTYIPTTTAASAAPRFDHDPTTGESLGLLVEESRTNLINYSQDFNFWGTGSTQTLQENAAVSPSGANDATKAIPSTVFESKNLYKNVSPNATNVCSIYVKAAGYTNFQARELGAARFYVNFNLSTSTYVGGGADYISADITPVGNGWYRCSVINSTSAVAYSIAGYPDGYDPGAAPPKFVGDGTSGIYIWGAQVEVGSFPTSYIPTTGTALTRSADVASITGTNFSSWYNQSEGSFYYEGAARNNPLNGLRFVSGTHPRSFLNSGSAGNNNVGSYDGTYSVGLVGGIDWQDGAKAAVSWSSATRTITKDGQVPYTAISNQHNIAETQVYLNRSSNGTSILSGTIARLTYFPERLPDSTLQAITQ
jgi:hypothetical protein